MAPSYANLFMEYFDRNVINPAVTYLTCAVLSSIY